jgi:hypothetical protein
MEPSFFDACHRGDLDVMTKAIAAGQDVNARAPTSKSVYQPTALAYAIWGQQADAVRMLLARGADPDLSDGDSNYCPLHWASYGKDNTELVGLLVDAGADLTVKTARGFTPIALARGLNDLVSSKPGVASVLEDAEFTRRTTPNNTPCNSGELPTIVPRASPSPPRPSPSTETVFKSEVAAMSMVREKSESELLGDMSSRAPSQKMTPEIPPPTKATTKAAEAMAPELLQEEVRVLREEIRGEEVRRASGAKPAVAAYYTAAAWCVVAVGLAVSMHHGGLSSAAMALLVLCFGLVFILGRAAGTSAGATPPPGHVSIARSTQTEQLRTEREGNEHDAPHGRKRRASREQQLNVLLTAEVTRLEGELGRAQKKEAAQVASAAASRKMGSTNGEASAILAFEGRNWLAD